MKTTIKTIITAAIAAMAFFTSCEKEEIPTGNGGNNNQTQINERNQPPVAKAGCVAFAEWPMKDACVAVADWNGDKEVQLDEALAVTDLNLSNKGISNLKGLECFTNVKKLNLSSNYGITDISLVENIIGIEWINIKGTGVKYADFGNYPVFYKLKYIAVTHGTTVNKGGCYEGPSFKIDTDYATPIEDVRKNYKVKDGGTYITGYNLHQKHTKGKGLYLHLEIGKFYNDNLPNEKTYSDLTWESGAAAEIYQKMIEVAFQNEPMKSLKEYFTIWSYNYKEKEIGPPPFIAEVPDWVPSGDNGDVCFGINYNEYDQSMFANSSSGEGAGRCNTFLALEHELVGHGIGGLGEEYCASQSYMSWFNNSPVGNPKDPKFPWAWAKLLKEESYKDKVKIIPRSKYGFDYFIPSEDSIMNTNVDPNFRRQYFNAVSRFHIYCALRYYLEMAKKDLFKDIYEQYGEIYYDNYDYAPYQWLWKAQMLSGKYTDWLEGVYKDFLEFDKKNLATIPY